MKRHCLISNLLTSLTVCLVLMLPACKLVGTQSAQDEIQSSKVTFRDTPSSTRHSPSMLAYYSWVQRCSLSELMKEYERLETNAADDDDGAQQINLRLALLLSLPDKSFGDDVRARLILKRYLGAKSGDGEDEDEAFALFLLDLLKERERYKSQVKSLETQVEDYPVVMSELRKERALRYKLEDQVQQLKNIEENLIEREQVNIPATKD